MTICINCGLDKVDGSAPPRYDVLNPDVDLDDPGSMGPYCEDCWPDTVTFREAGRHADATA